jgi:hypothetical protein
MHAHAPQAYWKVRWEDAAAVAPEESVGASEPSADATAFRTMVVYKDSQSNVALDPVEWTGTWRDARPINKEGAQPENVRDAVATAHARFFSGSTGMAAVCGCRPKVQVFLAQQALALEIVAPSKRCFLEQLHHV